MNINFGPIYSKLATGFPCSDDDFAPLFSVIKEVEGRARERTLNAHKIYSVLSEVDELLCIPKSSKDGIVVYGDPNAQDFPNSYKYTPMSTCFTAVFKSGRWYIVEVRRARCTNKRAVIDHTPYSREAIIAAHSVIRN